MQQDGARARLLHYLDEHTRLVLATEGPAGRWVDTVLFVNVGEDLYFACGADSRLAANLRANGKVTGSVSEHFRGSKSREGVELDGTVERIDDEGARRSIVAAYLDKFPWAAGRWHTADAAAIAGDPEGHDFFRLHLTHASLCDWSVQPVRDEEIFL